MIDIERSSSMDPWAYMTGRVVQYYDSADNIIKEISYKNPSEMSLKKERPASRTLITLFNTDCQIPFVLFLPPPQG